MASRRKIGLNFSGWRGPASALALPVLLVWGSTFSTATSGPARPAAAKSAPTRAELEKEFKRTVRPFLQTYCASCHGKDSPAAQLNLTTYATMGSVVNGLPHWSVVLEKLDAKQMPPSTVSKQPSPQQSAAVMAWIRAVRQYEADRNAGDPGPVPARRLSNSEYDYTIRDLTGVDLRPTREFPVDPANQEGFDNTGESLTLSPALMKKYVQAARSIADNLALTSTGMEFAGYPMLAETDRDKFCILRIVDFYKHQPTDYADYFQAAWRYKNRAALGGPNTTLNAVAARAGVSPRYLELVWKTLSGPAETVGPIAQLQTRWNALPLPNKGGVQPDALRTDCIGMRDWVLALRKKVAWKFDNLKVPQGFSVGGQCFVIWKDRQYASHRQMLYPNTLQVGGVPAEHGVPARRKKDKAKTMVPEKMVTDPIDPDLFVPEEKNAQAACLKSFDQFCGVFPDAFYISERGRMFVDDPGDKGRLLTAGLHNSMGYFRDDTPLMDLILDDKDRQKLNNLWLDFNMIAYVPERMHLEFFVYERAESGTMRDPEFNFARAEDKSSLSDANIKKLADLYLAKARRNGGEPAALQAIEKHFQWVSRTIRATEKARQAAEPAHLRALLDFAGRAYRRPLTATEQAGLLGFYQSLRKKEGLSSEDAIADSVIGVLLSPNFLFRADGEMPDAPLLPPKSSAKRTAALMSVPRPASRPPAAGGVEPLGDYALASRLSYFLWSSMPDKELLAHATAGDLHRPEVLASQTRRMLRDPRVRALALEFGGNWLDFRRFEENNAVDRNRFPTFTNDLREAMFQEPMHFLMDEFQQNRSVLDLLYGKYTFVNGPLAKHYGMTDLPVAKSAGDDWVRVGDADHYGRGGLLPMAVFLTQNSPGLRTSPVKRGNWMVKRVLGEHIPAPPPNVPELPKDEGASGDRTLRQALEQHRANPACAGCHARFDSYGLVFEGYGPIGERRTKDLGGKPVDTNAPFPGGESRSGVVGLQSFVREKRQQDFLDTYCRKLLSYGLGRSLLPSDESTLREMQKRLTQNGYRFNTLAETIVTSRQFRYRRRPLIAFVKG